MKTWLVAHRGAPTEARENTLQAFDEAKKYPIGYIELDVRVTRDDIAVIHHDPAIGSHIIADSTFAELRAIDNHLAHFEDVVAQNTAQPLMVELKSEGAAKHVAPYLVVHPKSFATSFLPQELDALARLGIARKRMFLAQHGMPFGHIKKATTHQLGGITINKWCATPFMLYRAQKQGLNIFIYTVNKRLWARWLRRYYPTILICTDYPCQLSTLR